jgi:hypothetical protein
MSDIISHAMSAGLNRRDAMKLATSGVAASSLSGWLPVLANAETRLTSKAKACIVLWMDGGPSHKDTFDLKPDSEGAGEFKPISTSATGVAISEHLPKLAKQMHRIALLRGMSTLEGAHPRAKYMLHTGYREGQGGIQYPALGSIVSSEVGRPEFPIPSFVSIGNRSYTSAYLGPRHQPLVVADPSLGVANLKSSLEGNQFDARVNLLENMEAGFRREYPIGAGLDHQVNYQRAVTMMKSREAAAFDLSKEPENMHELYGSSKFGKGCLLARRLVETGVKFVEVNLGGWDTHLDNFERVKKLSGTIDQPASALLDDLAARGMLDSTLGIWMGDFGRTPKINTRGEKPGRDHFPRAWTSWMAGGGVKGGRVIGRTDKQGGTVEDRPIAVIDFMATVCTLMGIDPTKQIQTPIGRPIRLVDKGHKLIEVC